jgi:hypothetical protein
VFHKIYEPVILEKIGSGNYIPDFLLIINDIPILLEIKGFVRGETGKKEEILKINAGIKYAKENNLKFCYCNRKNLSITELLDYEINDENSKKFIQEILKWELK